MTSLFQLAKSLSDIEASNLALKCVANAMLLIPSARHTWLAAGVEGGTTAMNILEVNNSNLLSIYGADLLIYGSKPNL